ncbi:MAG: hypothetical protein IGS48_12750 [Oscillatoriales cyanobacterium C42_A2020_001]|nr:hypothetical protein [Leptolyngbyaceae cyanobacterium C42_A2020_001]
MDTQAQARALMIRHQHLIKNREQCLLSRAANEIGMSTEVAMRNAEYGKARPYCSAYDHSTVGLS